MISICMLTIDRFEITKECLLKSIANIGNIDYEILVCDNGSTDKRIIDWVSTIPKLSYHRVNKSNEGVASSFNQLMIRAKGEFICLFGNDILMPPGWGEEMAKYSKAIYTSGLIGVECTVVPPPLTMVNNIYAHYLNEKMDRVFGTTLFRRELLEEVGGFCEEFCPYGLEDSDLNNRVNLAGLVSLYVPNMKSVHKCNDMGNKTEYRKAKDESLSKNTVIYGRRVGEYKKFGYFEPLPHKLAPLQF